MPDFLVRIPGQAPRLLTSSLPELRIGRGPDQDLILDDTTISRAHGRLLWIRGDAFYEDLGSRHGSFLNGARIQSTKQLRPTDTLTLGHQTLAIQEVDHRLGKKEPEEAAGERTQSLPVQDIQGWRTLNDLQIGFTNWRGALDLFYEFSLLVLKQQTAEQLLKDMHTRLFNFLNVGHSAILLKNAEGQLVQLEAHSRDPVDDSLLALPPSTLETAIERREAMLIRGELLTPSASGKGNPGEGATASAMAVPVEHAGEVLGLFYFDTGRSRQAFTENDVRIVASLGNLAAARLIQQRMAEELRRKEEQERDMQAIEAAAQNKSDFLAHMSHEMRTPMNAIMGFLHLAQGEALTPQAADYIQKIQSSGRALVSLLDDVLDQAKIEAGRLNLEVVPFRIETVLLQVQDIFSQAATAKGLQLSLAMEDPELPVLLGDPLRFRQVLINLVGNALKFTEQGGIEVRARTLDLREGRLNLEVSVQDTGIGLSPLQAATLFTPFTQAEASTSRHYGGTGLGLSISKRLVELMGGEIWVESSLGQGSAFLFTVEFPVAPDQTLPQDPKPLPTPQDWAPSLAGVQVLVVDDHSLNGELTSLLLGQMGVGVKLATTGTEGFHMAAEARYDLILMDLDLPDMDGFETTRRIRQSGMNQDRPIVALTAHALSTHRSKCLEAGMNDCITKPINPDLFYGVISRWAPETIQPTLPRDPADMEVVAGNEFLGTLGRLSPLVDVDLAMKRLGGRADLLIRFLKQFADDPFDADTIRESMLSGKTKEAASIAHDIKGMSNTLAITRMAEAATQLERRLRGQEEGPWEEPCQRLWDAMTEFRATMAYLD